MNKTDTTKDTRKKKNVDYEKGYNEGSNNVKQRRAYDLSNNMQLR